jgi:hypothetical protein
MIKKIMSKSSKEECHREDLEEESTHILEEAKMVAPGIQALFGFQLIAVFNSTFSNDLSSAEKYLHLVAMITTIIALILNFAPASYHRLAEPDLITRTFVNLSSRFITWAMVILMIGICLDFYLIAALITHIPFLSLFLTVSIGCVFVFFWIVFPKMRQTNKAKR